MPFIIDRDVQSSSSGESPISYNLERWAYAPAGSDPYHALEGPRQDVLGDQVQKRCKIKALYDWVMDAMSFRRWLGGTVGAN